MRGKSLFFNLICLLLMLLTLAGCGGGQVCQETAFALDTVVSVRYYKARDREAVLEALALCKDYEKVFSRTDPDSELYKLNAAGGGPVSYDLACVLGLARDIAEASGGRFDFTMGAVSALYGFSSDHPAVPDPDALEAALSHVGWRGVDLTDGSVHLADPETVLDLGALAKGYIADRMKELLVTRGVERAIINLGGNVLCLDRTRGGDGFAVGIQDPVREDSIAATVRTDEMSVVTSGVYQRSFTQDGVTYHHLLDPATGQPIRNGLRSVTVIGPASDLCDALSTACFAMGPEDGMKFIDGRNSYYALFITDDGALHWSAGAMDALKVSE